MPIFRVKSVKIYTVQKKFTRTPSVASVTNIRYAWKDFYSNPNDFLKLPKAQKVAKQVVSHMSHSLLFTQNSLLLNRFSSLATPHQIVKAWTATVTMFFSPGFLFLKRRSMCAQKPFLWTDPLFGIAKRPTQVCCANIKTKDYKQSKLCKSVGHWPIIMKCLWGGVSLTVKYPFFYDFPYHSWKTFDKIHVCVIVIM